MNESDAERGDVWQASGARIAALLAAIAVFALVYGTELGSFTLSIDEEIATIVNDREMVWLQQGRWGMALLTLLLPNFEAIPLLSTVLFGVGLAVVAWQAAADLRLGRRAALLFAVVHTGFPVWLHIAEFNTLAGGFGLGLAAAAVGAGLVLRDDWRARITGTSLLAFSASVYQTLGLYSLLYLLLALHARWREESPARPWRESLRRALPGLGLWAASLLGYWIVQKLAMLLAGANSTYVGGYLQLQQLQADPGGSATRIGHFLASLLLGRHPIYLAWGAGILFLVWPGLVPWRRRADPAAKRDSWLAMIVLLMLGLVLVAVPAVVSVATLSVRSYVVWPLVAAWLASRLGPLFDRFRVGWLAVALSYFIVVATSIGASMFYTDQVVHAADAALARDLMRAIEQAAGAARPIRVTLSGQRAYPFLGQSQVQRAELFGDSFFDHEGGNVYRVLMLMQLQGFSGAEGVVLSTRPELVSAAAAMPSWPAPGSVQLVDDVVVVKLGEPTAPQLAKP